MYRNIGVDHCDCSGYRVSRIRRTLRGSGLYYVSVLVHLLNVVCKSGRDDGPRCHRHVCRHSTRQRPGFYHAQIAGIEIAVPLWKWLREPSGGVVEKTKSMRKAAKMKKRVLFLCTGNSARSQMAEGLLRHLAGEEFEVYSAGTNPKGLHNASIAAMNEIGIDISQHRSKALDEFLGQGFDYVITVCDRAKQQCPVFPGATPIHWGFDDPAEAPEQQQSQAFRRARDEILRRLRLFLAAGSP